MRFAITTPTGKIGSKLVNNLLDRGGHELVLMTRDSNQVKESVDRGARAVQGRLEDMDYFAGATEGVDALFLVIPMNSRLETVFRDCTRIVSSACNAIKKNNIPRVVFVSSIGAHLEQDTGPIHVLREAEVKLRQVAPNLTVLRPTFYMDQFMSWMSTIAEDGAFYQPISATRPIPMIASTDVARYATDLLTDSSWTGQRTMSLHGPREYTFTETADVLSKLLGTTVRYVEKPAAEIAKQLRSRGWSEQAVNHKLEMLDTLNSGRLTDELPRSEWKIRQTTFETFVKNEFQPAFDEIAAVTI
jgi:uncharacterized protein YbjT (DUF2867 family)